MNEQIKAGADIHAGDGGYSEGTQEQYDAFVKVRNKSLAQGRIRDLAEQATTYIEPTANSGEGWIFDKQKFAELIVRECADDAKHHVMNISTYADADFVYEQIKRHFGVEE